MNKKLLIGLFSMLLITVLFAACRVVDADTLPKNPAVQMGSNQFATQTIAISKGQKINLVNTSASNHVIANGTWDGNNQKKGAEPGAPQLSDINVSGGSSLTTPPFNTAGTFQIYCTIHPGMKLTVTVK